MNNSFPENTTPLYDGAYDYTDEACNKTEVMKFGGVVTPIFFAVVFFSCVGNLLVLWVLIKYENLKSLTNAFLLNLAISDLVFTFGLPFWASDFVLNSWTFGDAVCKSVSFIFYLGYYSSLIFLTVMTIHRYMAVVQPMSMLMNITPYYSILISASIWVLSFCAATPHFIFNKVIAHADKNSASCDYSDIKWKLAGIYVQNILFLINFFTIAFCYIRILLRLHRPMSHTRPKTVRLILCIAIAFYLGWAPYNMAIFFNSLISYNVSPFNECHVSTAVDYVFHASRLMAFSHCCLNPVFYVFMGVKFRDHLKKALKSLCRKGDIPPDKRHSHLIYSNGEEVSMY